MLPFVIKIHGNLVIRSSYDFVITVLTFENAQASLALPSFSCPVLLSLADVALVTELGHALCLSEELLGLVGISLLD